MSNQALIKAISTLQEDEAMRLVGQALDKGEDPNSLIDDCQEGMRLVGDCYARSEYYLPELLMSGEMIKKMFAVVKPKLAASKTAAKGSDGRKGKVVLATVRGDVHNIGKNTVGFMLGINGFDVLDLGVDVPEEKIVEAIKEFKPQVVALSGLLSSIYDTMQSTVAAIEKAGLKDKVKIMVGGGMIDERVKEYCGADGFGFLAIDAVQLAKQWVPER